MSREEMLISTIASLESKVDLLETEFHDLHRLLLRLGFPQGIKTLKETVELMIAEEEGL